MNDSTIVVGVVDVYEHCISLLGASCILHFYIPDWMSFHATAQTSAYNGTVDDSWATVFLIRDCGNSQPPSLGTAIFHTRPIPPHDDSVQPSFLVLFADSFFFWIVKISVHCFWVG